MERGINFCFIQSILSFQMTFIFLVCSGILIGQNRTVQIFLHPSFFPRLEEGVLALSNAAGEITWVAEIPGGTRKDILQYEVSYDEKEDHILTFFARSKSNFGRNNWIDNYFARSFINPEEVLNLKMNHVPKYDLGGNLGSSGRITIEDIETWGNLRVYSAQSEKDIQKTFLQNKLRLNLVQPPNTDFYATLRGNNEDHLRYLYVPNRDLKKNKSSFADLSNDLKQVAFQNPDEKNFKTEIKLRSADSKNPCGQLSIVKKENDLPIILDVPVSDPKIEFSYSCQAMYPDTVFRFRTHSYSYDFSETALPVQTIDPLLFTPIVTNGQQDELIVYNKVPGQSISLFFELENQESYCVWTVIGESQGEIRFKRPQFTSGTISKTLTFPFSKEIVLQSISVGKKINGINYEVNFRNF